MSRAEIFADPHAANQTRSLYRIDPLSDVRWNALVTKHPRASVFHTSGWLEALHRTYGYTPIAYTTSPPAGDLQNAVVFCRIESWLTGRRLVSLPFADHCEPLLSGGEDLKTFVSSLGGIRDEERVRYIEIRPQLPCDAFASALHPRQTYCFHQLDLLPDLDVLFNNLQKDSIQRKIRRAAREGITFETGVSESQLDAFWRLFIMTRRRHGVPPPPRRWFQNVLACLGQSAELRVAFHGKQAVAAVITLRCNETMVYKYACSDASLHHLGGMSLLIWESIQAAKRDHLKVFDFGRSDLDETGLITFKDRWGASRSSLTYMRFPVSAGRGVSQATDSRWGRAVTRVLARLPDGIFASVGNLLYRHIG